MQDEITFNQAEVNEYHDYQDNRGQAIKLLNKLKQREAQMAEADAYKRSKIVWKDQQPTLVETTRLEFRTKGANLSDGFPATDMLDRVPAAWEAKLDKKRRRQYTLDETPLMTFAGSAGMLGPEYYVDEEELEAYIQTLEEDATTTD